MTTYTDRQLARYASGEDSEDDYEPYSHCPGCGAELRYEDSECPECDGEPELPSCANCGAPKAALFGLDGRLYCRSVCAGAALDPNDYDPNTDLQ